MVDRAINIQNLLYIHALLVSGHDDLFYFVQGISNQR